MNVFPAVIVKVDKSDTPAREGPRELAKLGGPGDVLKGLSANVPQQTVYLPRKIVIDNVDTPIVIEVFSIRSHPGNTVAMSVISHPVFQSPLPEGSIALIDEEE